MTDTPHWRRPLWDAWPVGTFQESRLARVCLAFVIDRIDRMLDYYLSNEEAYEIAVVASSAVRLGVTEISAIEELIESSHSYKEWVARVGPATARMVAEDATKRS